MNFDVYRRMADPLPEISDSARDYARQNPDSWMYYTDSTLPEGARPVMANVIGGRHIDARGEFDEVWINPEFLPQPSFARVELTSLLDLQVWRLLHGYVNIGEFVAPWDRLTVLVELDGTGGFVLAGEAGKSAVRIFTSGRFVPEGVQYREMSGAEFIEVFDQLSPDLVDVNPGSELLAFEWPFAKLRDSRNAMSELLGDMARRKAEAGEEPEPIDAHERFRGAMLAGAMGDALGYAIEFDDIGMIRRHHGENGLTEPVLRDGVTQISDDTQMMLFTLEGLIRAHVARRMEPRDNDPVPEVQHGYQRWYHTQNQAWEVAGGPYARQLQRPDGWLITNWALFANRAPGSTCMSALAKFAQTGVSATPQNRINDSKGCGGVMRAAPVAAWSNDPSEVFYAAVGTAALTHSHPSGFLSAGVLAVIVHQLIREVPLRESVRMARDLLVRWPQHEEQLQVLDRAVALAERGAVTPEELKDELGQGWVGEEALAIGLYAVLATDNLRDALLLSVNHSGDSDSTGIVCGNIGGALYGTRAIPADWLQHLELREAIETISNDALAEFSPGPPTDQSWTQRYPAW